MALKSARIVDLCGKSSGFADFENTADRGSAVIFEADSGLCPSYVRTLGPKQNLDHKSFFSHDRYVNEFIQIISFFERSSFKLKWWNRELTLKCKLKCYVKPMKDPLGVSPSKGNFFLEYVCHLLFHMNVHANPNK